MSDDYEATPMKSWDEVARAFYRGDEDLKENIYSRSIQFAFGKLGKAIQDNKIARGWTVTTPEKWNDDNQVPADLALIHSEVSEALEAFRVNNSAGFKEEMADIVIRVIGLCAGLEIDLGGEILAKIEKNKARPHKHGGKKI